MLNYNEEIVEGCPRELKKILCKRLQGKVFHITSVSGYKNIQKCKAILHPNHKAVTKRVWNSNSYFKNRNCISVCDFYTNMDIRKCLQAITKYRFYDPNHVVKDNISYILILNQSIYKNLISWKEWEKEKSYSEQIVPNLESGIKNKIPISKIDSIIKVVSCEKSIQETLNRYDSYFK